MLHLPFSHTVTLIIITVAISLLAFSNQAVMNRLIFWPPAMQRGQYDRFITHGFIHADGAHLLFNMITLFFFGNRERIVRNIRRTAFFAELSVAYRLLVNIQLPGGKMLVFGNTGVGDMIITKIHDRIALKVAGIAKCFKFKRPVA